MNNNNNNSELYNIVYNLVGKILQNSDLKKIIIEELYKLDKEIINE